MWYVCNVCLLFYYCIYWTSSLLIKFFNNDKFLIDNNDIQLLFGHPSSPLITSALWTCIIIVPMYIVSLYI